MKTKQLSKFSTKPSGKCTNKDYAEAMFKLADELGYQFSSKPPIECIKEYIEKIEREYKLAMESSDFWAAEYRELSSENLYLWKSYTYIKKYL